MKSQKLSTTMNSLMKSIKESCPSIKYMHLLCFSHRFVCTSELFPTKHNIFFMTILFAMVSPKYEQRVSFNLDRIVFVLLLPLLFVLLLFVIYLSTVRNMARYKPEREREKTASKTNDRKSATHGEKEKRTMDIFVIRKTEDLKMSDHQS